MPPYSVNGHTDSYTYVPNSSVYSVFNGTNIIQFPAGLSSKQLVTVPAMTYPVGHSDAESANTKALSTNRIYPVGHDVDGSFALTVNGNINSNNQNTPKYSGAFLFVKIGTIIKRIF